MAGTCFFKTIGSNRLEQADLLLLCIVVAVFYGQLLKFGIKSLVVAEVRTTSLFWKIHFTNNGKYTILFKEA
jgi:hypothetical protein